MTNILNTRRNRNVYLCLSLLAMLILGACNLGTPTDAPPTLVLSPSATPPSTLGPSADGGGNGAGDVGNTTVSNVSGAPLVSVDQEIFDLLNKVESDRLMAHVSTLQGFYTRHVNSTQNSPTYGIGAARNYIHSQFEQIRDISGGNPFVFDQDFRLNINGYQTTQYNVVMIVQGTETGAGTVVVGAHYDSIGPDINNPDIFAPGANDNGTGVAAIIEMARIMSQAPTRSSIIFVAFSAEEEGRLGSKAFVKYLLDTNIDVISMINIDTIGNIQNFAGAVNDSELRVFSAGPNDTSISRHLARNAEFISFTQGLNMKLILEDAEDREGRYGDHFSFSERGIPAIRFIQAYEEKRNGDATDTIEFIEEDYFRRAVQSIVVVLQSMASGPRPPRDVVLRDREGGIESLVWDAVPGSSYYLVALRRRGSLSYDQQFQVNETAVDWDGFRSYEGIAIAAVGNDGIIGPLSQEYKLQQ